LIAIFKNESGVDNAEIKLPTFPDGTFRISSAMTGKSIGNFTGQQFRQGVRFPLSQDYRVDLMEVRK